MEKGLFSTVGFPEYYENDSDCEWKITVPEGQKLQLTFHILNVSCNSKFFMYIGIENLNRTYNNY